MKKWMIVMALVVGIMIGLLVNNPFQVGAQSMKKTIEMRFLPTSPKKERGYCFATHGGSITFIGMSNSWADCRNGKFKRQ